MCFISSSTVDLDFTNMTYFVLFKVIHSIIEHNLLIIVDKNYGDDIFAPRSRNTFVVYDFIS